MAKCVNIVVRIEVRVNCALTFLDYCMVGCLGLTILTVRSQLSFSAVEVDSMLIQVRFWAVNTLACASSVSVGIVETAEPGGADIRGEGPFANPEIVFYLSNIGNGASVVIAVSANIIVLAPPGEVLMSVHNNVLHVIVIEKIVPGACVRVESVMEDELEARLLISHHVSHIFVELLKHIEIRAPPWFVDWLDSIDGWVIAPFVEKTLDGVFGPVNVFLVH